MRRGKGRIERSEEEKRGQGSRLEARRERDSRGEKRK